MLDKLYILYTPERTHSNFDTFFMIFCRQTVYDQIEMRDGELIINSGVCNSSPKSELFFAGRLNSLPLLDLIQGITMFDEDFQMD